MRLGRLIFLPLLALPLAGCLDNDAERGLAGAAIGAAAADALDKNAGVGAAIGAGAGVFCNDAGVCR